jgi:PAS domain S-box-containing protein
MRAETETPEAMLRAAISAVRAGGRSFSRALDALPAAIYLTDTEGLVTHYNRACVAFAGRTPRVGQDSWCVTWKLYTEEGVYLPHDRCPMAVAVRERRAVRGVQAVAERPDGTLVDFRPHPTPLLDEAGRFVGAINLLLDVSGRKQAQTLRHRAAKCRRLVSLWPHRRSALLSAAADYDREALAIERRN